MLHLAFLIFGLGLAPHVAANASTMPQCMQGADELRCVLRHGASIYQKDPAYFWRVLNQARSAAQRTDSAAAVTGFLSLAELRDESAEIQEFIAEGIENLCADKPARFGESLRMLNARARAAVIDSLRHPLYLDANELRCLTVHRPK